MSDHRHHTRSGRASPTRRDLDDFVRSSWAASSAARSPPTSGGPSGCSRAPTASARSATCTWSGPSCPQGVVTAEQLEALAEVTERWLARLRPHLAPARTCSSTSCPGRGAEAALRAAGRGGDDLARGLRQLGAQRHRLPVRRGRAPTRSSTPRPTPRRSPATSCATRSRPRCRASSRSPSRAAREDHAAAAIHDLGFFARVRDGRRGFEVRRRRRHRHAAGLGPAAGRVPAGRRAAGPGRGGRCASSTGWAIARTGQANRLKYLVRKLGFGGLPARGARRSWGGSGPRASRRSPSIPSAPPEEGPPDPAPARRPPAPEASRRGWPGQVARGPGIVPEVATPSRRRRRRRWPPCARTNVRPQRQAGLVTVPWRRSRSATSPRRSSRVLADLARAYADGTVRFTRDAGRAAALGARRGRPRAPPAPGSPPGLGPGRRRYDRPTW